METLHDSIVKLQNDLASMGESILFIEDVVIDILRLIEKDITSNDDLSKTLSEIHTKAQDILCHIIN